MEHAGNNRGIANPDPVQHRGIGPRGAIELEERGFAAGDAEAAPVNDGAAAVLADGQQISPGRYAGRSTHNHTP